MVTIRDVAKEAGVSVMTASRVARESDGVSDKTRKHVLEVMERMGYHPDKLAQALRNRTSTTIGIIVSDVENTFYMQVIAQMEQILKAKGFSMLISFSNEDPDVELSSLKMMLGARVGGVMITPVKRDDDKLHQLLKNRSIPALQMYRNVYPDIDSVTVDDRYGAKVATRRLLEEGHRRVLLLDVDWEGRSQGYRAAFAEMQLPVQEAYVQTLRLNVSEEARIAELIQRLRPSAIVAGTNLLGYGTVAACRKLDLHIPSDISVIIQDDITWISLLDITAISQPMNKIAQRAVDMIISKMERTQGDAEEALAESAAHQIIRPSLIERASTGAPKLIR